MRQPQGEDCPVHMHQADQGTKTTAANAEVPGGHVLVEQTILCS